MHAASLWRRAELTRVLPADILGVCGTKYPAQLERCSRTTAPGRIWLDAGWAAGPMSNRSAGVAVVLGPRFRERDVHSTHAGPAGLAGRFLGVHIRNCRVDIGIVVAYFPPAPWKAAEQARYRTTCRTLTAAIDEFFDKLGAGATPLLLMDLNDGMGKEGTRATQAPVRTEVVSEGSATLERTPDGAGALCRAVLEKHGMVAANALATRPYGTFFPAQGSPTLIDYVCAPAALVAAAFGSRRLMQEGRLLQPIHTLARREHVPVEALLRYELWHQPREERPARWNQDELMRGVREQWRRHEFLDALDKETGHTRTHAGWTQALTQPTPDRAFELLNSCLERAGRGLYDLDHPRTPAQAGLAETREALLQRRLALRASLEHSNEEELLAVQDALKEVTALNKRAHRQAALERKKRIMEEMDEAWAKRRLAEVGRLGRLLGRPRIGPKRRSYTSLSGALPTPEEWSEAWAKAGHLGGMSATPVVWEDFADGIAEAHLPLPELTPEHVVRAHADLASIRRYMQHAPKRKASPTIPLELLWMALFPHKAAKPPPPGLGATANAGSARFERCLHEALAHVRRTQLAPLAWHRSRGVALVKKAGVPGPAGRRVVHLLDPIGKGFFAGMLQRKKAQRGDRRQHHWDHGFLPGRRREGAILVELLGAWKLRRLGVSSIASHKDMTNAFPSVLWATKHAATSELLLPHDCHLGRQRYVCATVELPSAPGEANALLKPGCGGLMGDPFEVANFLACSSYPVGAWQDWHVRCAPGGDAMLVPDLVGLLCGQEPGVGDHSLGCEHEAGRLEEEQEAAVGDRSLGCEHEAAPPSQGARARATPATPRGDRAGKLQQKSRQTAEQRASERQHPPAVGDHSLGCEHEAALPRDGARAGAEPARPGNPEEERRRHGALASATPTTPQRPRTASAYNTEEEESTATAGSGLGAGPGGRSAPGRAAPSPRLPRFVPAPRRGAGHPRRLPGSAPAPCRPAPTNRRKRGETTAPAPAPRQALTGNRARPATTTRRRRRAPRWGTTP